MSNKIPPVNHNIAEPWWGLKRDITPCFGARLVQEGNRLHYLADRASITGQFSDADLRHLDQAFPLLLKQLELISPAVNSIPAISTASRSTQKD